MNPRRPTSHQPIVVLPFRRFLQPGPGRGLFVGALIIGASVASWSCGESTPTGVQPPLMRAERGAETGLVSCAPRASESVTTTIDVKGGTIRVGPHTLRIPAHALERPVAITATAPSDTLDLLQFQPEGLEFRKAADLSIDYSNCQQGTPKRHVRIAYVDDAMNILSYVAPGAGAPHGPRGHVVIGRLEHFSNYAVAW